MSGIYLLDRPEVTAPTSVKQLHIFLAQPGHAELVKNFIREHHSILPNPPAAWKCAFFACYTSGNVWAVSTWGLPTARREDQKTTLELTRLVTRTGAPKNTCTRLMSENRRVIRRLYPEVTRLISYQDCDAHNGTIYKADNWRLAYPCTKRVSPKWTTRPNRTVGSERTHVAKWERRLAP